MLASYQKITRVIAGKPFGNGSAGDLTTGSLPSITQRNGSGSASSTSFTLTSSGFANGDVVLIHQARGTGYGQWEINQIVSGGGSTSLTLKKALQYTYTNSGSSVGVMSKINMYKNLTSNSDWHLSAWDGSTGGFWCVAVQKLFDMNNVLNAGEKGYRNTTGAPTVDNPAGAGEGYPGVPGNQYSANGNGGGGGGTGHSGGSAWGNGGGGGGNGTAGGNGDDGNYNNGPVGAGGGTAGNSDLTNFVFGGASGGGGTATASYVLGVRGGGALLIFAKQVDFTSAYIMAQGANGNGTGNQDGASGGGAGGSILIACETAILGTSQVRAYGGTGGIAGQYGGYYGGNGGNGGDGRIALHYSKSYSGTVTQPSMNVTLDPSLKEAVGGGFYKHFI